MNPIYIDISEQEKMPFMVSVQFDGCEMYATVMTICEYSPDEIYYSVCDTEITDPDIFTDPERTSRFVNYDIDDKGYSCGSFDLDGLYEEIMGMNDPQAFLLYHEYAERFHK